MTHAASLGPWLSALPVAHAAGRGEVALAPLGPLPAAAPLVSQPGEGPRAHLAGDVSSSPWTLTSRPQPSPRAFPGTSALVAGAWSGLSDTVLAALRAL